MNGNLSQSLGGSWYAQGRADYSSDLTVDRLYDSDIARATRRTRNYGGSVSGTTKGLRFTGTYDRNEYFAENCDLVGARFRAAHQTCPGQIACCPGSRFTRRSTRNMCVSSRRASKATAR